MKRIALAFAHALLAGLLAGGCTQAPNLDALKAEGAGAVLRTDSFQSAASNGRVLVVGAASGVLLSSADGGRHWLRLSLATPASVIAMTHCPDGSFVGLDFYKKVWLGDATGRQWHAQPLDKAVMDQGVNALAVHCDGTGRLWVVGSNSALLVSRDHGASWSHSKLGGDAILTTVQFVDEQHGFITGEFGVVLTTEDGGATWHKQARIPDDFYPYSALFLDAKRGWASGLGGVLQATVDGGKTWQRQPNHSGAPLYGLLRQGDQVYGVGGSQMAVLSGEAWERDGRSPAGAAPLVAAAALDSGALLLVGAGGSLHLIPPETHPASADKSAKSEPQEPKS
jgi:photosystem II stability/assembly factor-like uncharacterized protein